MNFDVAVVGGGPAGSLAAAVNRSFEHFWKFAAAQPRARAKKGKRQ